MKIKRLSKFATAVVAVLVCCQQSFAQERPAGALAQAVVIVESFDWYLEKPMPAPRVVPSYNRSLPEGQSQNSPSPSLATVDREKFIYRLRVRNLSSETVAQIVWRCDFIDPVTNLLAATRKFASQVEIRPHRRKSVYAESITPPTASVDVRLFLLNKRRPYVETVTLESVSFGKRDVGKP